MSAPDKSEAPAGRVVLLNADPVVALDIAEMIRSICAECAVIAHPRVADAAQDLAAVAGAIVVGALDAAERLALHAALARPGCWLIEIDAGAGAEPPAGLRRAALSRPFSDEMLAAALRSVAAAREPG